MSEEDIGRSQQVSSEGSLNVNASSVVSSAGQQLSAGALLRQARQAQQLDIATLAALLKVSVKKLEALEHDEFAQLLDPVFARALASSVCRILKIDSVPVLQRLPVITAFKVTSQNRGINTPFRARGGAHGSAMWPSVSRSAILIGLALLIGAIVLIFLPDIQQEITKRQQAASAGVAREIELVEPASIATPGMLMEPSDVGASELTRNPPREVASAATVQPSLPASNSLDAPAKSMIAFNATGESWIKVTDNKGAVVLERTLRAGESVEVSGALPLFAVVGRADAIKVQVRGQAFGLGGVTSNNVARFEVK